MRRWTSTARSFSYIIRCSCIASSYNLQSEMASVAVNKEGFATNRRRWRVFLAQIGGDSFFLAQIEVGWVEVSSATCRRVHSEAVQLSVAIAEHSASRLAELSLQLPPVCNILHSKKTKYKYKRKTRFLPFCTIPTAHSALDMIKLISVLVWNYAAS